MIVSRWIAFAILAAGFGFLAAINAYWLGLQFTRKSESTPSLAPLMGGVVGVLAVLALPVATLTDRIWWIWVPIALDVGTGYYFVEGALFLLGLKTGERKIQPTDPPDRQ